MKSSDKAKGDLCSYDFKLPRSEADYSNILGFITTQTPPPDWGPLSAPEVGHANSDVVVSVESPRYIRRSRSEQKVSLPAGRHTLRWRAETQVSPLFDYVLPVALFGLSELRYGSIFFDQGASAAKQAKRLSDAKQLMLDLAFEAGAIGTDQQVDLDNQTAVTHERLRSFTVYDVLPPMVEVLTPELTYEASDFGGVLRSRVAREIRQTVTARDACDRPVTLSDDLPTLLPIGTTEVTWTATDFGPSGPDGGRLTDSAIQYIRVEDTQAPIMVPPPGRVLEVAAGGLDASAVDLGVPMVVDLADPMPTIVSTAPAYFPIESRTAVEWTVTDASGNANTATQWITVKQTGTNDPPVADATAAATLTAQPVDILLTASDPDLLDGRFDPLALSIVERPARGEFVAPLLPFFIEDYRTNPAGPFGEPFRLSNNRARWVYDNVCRQGGALPLDWVYRPRFVKVTDEGTVFMIDSYWHCNPSDASTRPRISKWDRDGNYLGQIDYTGTTDAFVMDQDGYIYVLSRVGAGSSTTLTLSQIRPDFDTTTLDPYGDAWRFDYASTPGDPVSSDSYSYARVDSQRGLIYLNDRRRIFVFDVRDDLTDGVATFRNGRADRYLGALNAGEQVIGCSDFFSSWTGFAMEVDSEGNLYVADSCADRIHKFEPSAIDEQGGLFPGAYVGWMGRRETTPNKPCDTDDQVSRG